MVYQIGQSKAIRNATLRAMPKWVIDEAIEIARASELQKIKKEPPEKARAKAIKFFAEYGVTVDRIAAKFDGRTPDQWTPEDLLVLRESAASVSEGVKVSEIFPPIETTASEPITLNHTATNGVSSDPTNNIGKFTFISIAGQQEIQSWDISSTRH